MHSLGLLHQIQYLLALITAASQPLNEGSRSRST
jgi:hypothetical protein